MMHTSSHKVVIVGGGRIGNALAKIFQKNGVEVVCCDRDKARCTPGVVFPDVVKSASSVFLCVPSWEVRNVVVEMKPHLSHSTSVVCLAKGIEPVTKNTMDELLEELFLSHPQPFAILGGPLFAEELEKSQHGFAVAGTHSEEVFRTLEELFRDSSVSVQRVWDVRGVALLGVLKNIYAMACGMLDGIGEGNNAKGHVIGRALQEMEIILETLGGKRETVKSDAGVGDFVATAVSSYSRNRTSGEAFIQGKKKEELQSESVRSLALLCERLGKEKIKELPLLRAIYEVVENHEKELRAKVIHDFLNQEGLRK